MQSKNFSKTIFIVSFVSVISLTSSFFVASSGFCDAAAGKAKYDLLCASCHGALGAGDGPVAAGLPPDAKPRSFVEAKYKFATDETKFKELLRKGGVAVGLSPMMPPQSALSEQELSDLYAYVVSLKK